MYACSFTVSQPAYAPGSQAGHRNSLVFDSFGSENRIGHSTNTARLARLRPGLSYQPMHRRTLIPIQVSAQETEFEHRPARPRDSMDHPHPPSMESTATLLTTDTTQLCSLDDESSSVHSRQGMMLHNWLSYYNYKFYFYLALYSPPRTSTSE